MFPALSLQHRVMHAILFCCQGLRTLELCVDNLQPDFLYDHIQPVRAELMQALWTTLRVAPDSIAQVAFRVLGKLGGSNRKMLREPQKVVQQCCE